MKTKKKSAMKTKAKKASPKKVNAKKIAAVKTRTTTINPYLTFTGNCEEAFNFYKSVFGGKFKQVSRFGEMPSSPGYELPDNYKEKILHISLPISKETILMGSDSNPAMGQVTIGQHLSLSVDAASKSEADRISKSLSKGGKITMPMADMFWGTYFGMLIDKFGITWMVNYDPKGV